MMTLRRVDASDRPAKSMEIDDLVRKSRDGSLEAFDALTERYYRPIFHLACRMLKRREVAEDAAQEIFIKAWENLPRFRGASQFSTWLHAIAVRHCLNVSKRMSHEILHEGADDGDGVFLGRKTEGAPDDFASRCHRRLAIREALEKLPEKIRLVVVLHYYSDYAVKEIAEALNLPLRTVYSRLEAGRSRLERDLRPWAK
jgi:RNA polymerase sigma-70 factor (ECF subfamily)